MSCLGNQPDENGQTEKQKAKAYRDLDLGIDLGGEEVEPPQDLMYLYDMFFSMRFSLVFNGDDRQLQPRQPLTNYDINSYDSNNNLDLQAWEIDAIFSLDATYNRANKWNQH